MQYSKFTYDIISDSNYDNLIADVLYEDELLLNVSQDEAPTHPKITFFFTKNKFFWDIPIMHMFEIIHDARVDLNEDLTKGQFDIFCNLESKTPT